MIKRLIDIIVSIIGLIIFFPFLIIISIIIFLQDFSSPFYIAERVGKDKSNFRMVKLRSMIVNAEATGVDSTSSDDPRITKIGYIVRKYKLDEIVQLWNVLKNDMSLVGPRPNVKSETDLYSKEENLILKIKPGITDFSSIVFSDEGKILEKFEDPDLAYNQIIRPWKSRLGILYLQKKSIILDIQLIFYTAISLISKKVALNWIEKKLKIFNASNELIDVCKRKKEIKPSPPPGFVEVVKSRKII